MLNLTDINFTGKTNAELDRSQKLWKIGFLSDKEEKISKKMQLEIYVCPLQVYQLLPGREREKGF